MRVYIAASSQEQAQQAARAIEDAGHVVTSTWHEQVPGTPGWLADEDKAARNFAQIEESDYLALIADPEGVPKVSGGRFVEAGYAEGRPGVQVVIVGRRENGILASPDFFDQVDDLTELVEYLDEEYGC